MSKFLGYEACPKCQERGADRSGDNAGVYSDGSKHCFACGWHSFPKHYNRFVNDQEISTEEKAKLPNDFTWHVPARAWQWLLQYGLPVSYWRPHCGYSEAEERLIIRVGEPLAFSLGRDVAVPTERAKPRRKWYAYGDCHKQSHFYGTPGNKVVLVEDVISAHKVGHAGHLCLPLFGTNVHDCHLRSLLYYKLPIVLWLDKDQEALSRKRAARLNTLLGVPVSIITTDKDPKNISINNINEVLK